MKKVDAVVQPRKQPRQKRSQDTVVVILEAAVEVICKHGLTELNTNRIAERAGVSIGSVYQYFPGREAILARLVRDMRSGMLEDFKAAIDDQCDTTLKSAVDALVSAALQHHLKNPYLTSCLEKAEEELPLDEETQELKVAMSAIVVSVLQHHAIPNPEKTAFDLVALSHGITHAATQSGQTDFVDLHMRVMRAVMGYLENTA